MKKQTGGKRKMNKNKSVKRIGLKQFENQNEKGITLIALVITVVILIILATVSINVVLGEGGLIQRAQQAKDLTEQAALEEQQGLNSLMDQMANIMSEDQTPPPEPDVPYVDESIAVAPQVSEGMTPVKYDTKQNKWVRTDETDNTWYNYANKEWANVVLGGATFNDGVLDESKTYSMLVWIPRYAYKITSQYHQSGSSAGGIDIVFIDTANKGKDGSKTYSTTYPSATTGGAMSDYVVHPAFDYGGTALPGFWVGKFETSHTGCTTDKSTGETDTNNSTLIPQIKAGITSWRNITVDNIFKVCTEMNKTGNPYGLNSNDNVVDPHMMKNSEWGAVVYLSQNTTYGKGDEVWINNNRGYITGNAGESASAAEEEITNDYKSIQGQEASTTGNVTGVYDMSGGTWEYVAAYVNNSYAEDYAKSLIDSVDKGNTKYADVYSTGSRDAFDENYAVSIPENGYNGDAVWETSSSSSSPYMNSWYSDYSYFPNTNSQFFVRGGPYSNATAAGAFSFGSYYGYNDSFYSFRVVVPVLQ